MGLAADASSASRRHRRRQRGRPLGRCIPLVCPNSGRPSNRCSRGSRERCPRVRSRTSPSGTASDAWHSWTSTASTFGAATDRPLARYFPEVVRGLEAVRGDRRPPDAAFVLDGEIVIDASPDQARTPSFATLMSRLHPAPTRVERLSRDHPASYIAFDCLAAHGHDVRGRPFTERRRLLERVLSGARGSVRLTAATRDASKASIWLDMPGCNIDGVVAKPDSEPYAPGRRTMIKVKTLRTADCIVSGLRIARSGVVSSLLLGLYDDADALRHVGVVTQLPASDRKTLLDDLAPLAISIRDHPWRDGFLIAASPLGRLKGSAGRWTPEMGQDWLPVRPERVVEVGFDQVDGDRFRHPARLVRWRPDRTASSCSLDQIVSTIGASASPDAPPTIGP